MLRRLVLVSVWLAACDGEDAADTIPAKRAYATSATSTIRACATSFSPAPSTKNHIEPSACRARSFLLGAGREYGQRARAVSAMSFGAHTAYFGCAPGLGSLNNLPSASSIAS